MINAIRKYMAGEPVDLAEAFGETTTVKVVMLGPRRTGKTTLLAVMHERFSSVVGSSDLELRMGDERTKAILEKRLDEHQGMIPKSWPGGFGPGIEGTAERSEFNFVLRHKHSETLSGAMKLIFVDSPGGWTESDMDGNIEQDLGDADAAIIAVDAPYLMEDSGCYHDVRNIPARIAELVRSSFATVSRRKLMLLVPVRCEAYMTSPLRSARMAEAVERGYREMIGQITQLPPGAIKVVITPVQTTGCLVFKQWRAVVDPPNVGPIFMSRTAHPEYTPVDSDQPLRQLLFFLLEEHLAKRNIGFAGVCRRILNLNRDLVRSANEFSEGCKYGPGFKVLAP